MGRVNELQVAAMSAGRYMVSCSSGRGENEGNAELKKWKSSSLKTKLEEPSLWMVLRFRAITKLRHVVLDPAGTNIHQQLI